MTSRLKRKLNDIGVDPSSSRANENFCLIGTPLPPLEKSKDTGEFVPLWKQEVRDEKGRRRLHGAFTGGFSAGYFNSVGSKEGWVPSTFVSSRSDRSKKKALRPEDFMDEEDLAELRDSRQLIDENEEMNFGGTEAGLRRKGVDDTENDSIANALAASLAPATEDSAGARILRKMGWRMGQGIGPRITYQQRKTQDRAHVPETTFKDDEDDDEAKKHMYPRRDTPVLIVSRKDNSHGLGYTPGMSLSESLGAGRGKESSGPNISAGFGLGALNDADDDDLDIYDGGLRPSTRRTVAFDTAEDDDSIIMGSSRHQQSRISGSRVSPQALGSQKFRNGTTVLTGFIISNVPVAEDRWYPLPDVPKGWKPNPRKVWEADSNKENHASKGKEHEEPPKSHAEWKNSLLSAGERGSILGETPLPRDQRSVFDYMSQKDRERLQNIKDNISKPTSVPTNAPELPPLPRYIPTGEVSIPRLHPSVAKAALSGFQPFTADPVKQMRYTTFLNFAAQGGIDSPIPGLEPTPGQSVEEFNKELADYAKSATVFKPLSGAMAGRFRSAVVVEHGPKVIEGLHTPDASSAQDEGSKEEHKEEKEEDPRAAAVRLGMYGLLTREVTPWQPARLLCKRFGVKDPEIDASSADTSMHPVPTSDTQEPVPPAATSVPLAITDGSTTISVVNSGPRNLSNVGLGEDEDQGRDTLTYQRPSMDVFKAIFASDDEDSEDEDDSKENGKDDKIESDEAPQVSENTAAQAHLKANISAPSTNDTKEMQPAQSQPIAPASGPIDLASFKPTFVPRSERESKKDKEKDKDKKEKKKAGKVLVSFGDEEDGLQINVSSTSKKSKRKDKDKDKDRDGERKRKKRKEEKQVEVEEDDDSMWVEKPAPEVVAKLALESIPSAPSPETPDIGNTGPHRSRKRAIDFM